uniref:Uncharacterized protein n=1 Tax=Rhipicephalus zambeziensis TaxID=60191 RepID=A0A224YLS9_9ACAR
MNYAFIYWSISSEASSILAIRTFHARVHRSSCTHYYPLNYFMQRRKKKCKIAVFNWYAAHECHLFCTMHHNCLFRLKCRVKHVTQSVTHATDSLFQGCSYSQNHHKSAGSLHCPLKTSYRKHLTAQVLQKGAQGHQRKTGGVLLAGPTCSAAERICSDIAGEVEKHLLSSERRHAHKSLQWGWGAQSVGR